MATLYEYYNTGDNDFARTDATTWRFQTFTPDTTHNISSVKLKGYKDGLPGTLTVSIRATSGGEPTGGDLVSGTYNGDSLSSSSPGAWFEITMTGSSPTLTASSQYAIVVRGANAENNSLMWRINIGGSYTGGTGGLSTDSGSSWTILSSYDAMFEEYGDVLATFIPRQIMIF